MAFAVLASCALTLGALAFLFLQSLYDFAFVAVLYVAEPTLGVG